jgi:hypothetical protein
MTPSGASEPSPWDIRDAVKLIGDLLGTEQAGLLLELVLYASSEDTRRSAAAALIDPGHVPTIPTLTPDNSPEREATRRLGLAAVLAAALLFLREQGRRLDDPDLDRALGQAHGRVIGILVALRRTS